MKFNYTDKTRKDFLHDVVKQLIKRRHELGITQDNLNHNLGVADRLVSHWECGRRTPTAFHLYCWTDALKSKLIVLPKPIDIPKTTIDRLLAECSNDNDAQKGLVANDNVIAYQDLIRKISSD